MIPLHCIILNFKHTSETSKPRGCNYYKIHIVIFSLVMYHLLNIFPEMRTSLLTNMTRWPHVYRAQWGELPLPSQCRSLSRICEGGSQVRTILGLILLSFRIKFLECVFLCFLYVMWMMCAGKRVVVFCGGKMWMIFFPQCRFYNWRSDTTALSELHAPDADAIPLLLTYLTLCSRKGF